MSSFNFSPKEIKERQEIREHGRILARGMEDIKVVKEKNVMRAEKRRQTMLENAAEIALSGGVQRIGSRNK